MAATRQVIGKRRVVTAFQARGVERRDALIRAACELLESHSMEDISFREIAQVAKVPESSAYHFYANKYDLYSAVASETLTLFEEAYSKPISDEQVGDWADILDVMVDRAIEIFRSNVVARELLVGPKTPPEIKPDDSSLKQVYSAITDQYEEHFVLSSVSGFKSKLKITLVLFDAILTAGLRESGDMNDEIAEEAKRACIGYLSTYFPDGLERRRLPVNDWGDFPL